MPSCQRRCCVKALSSYNMPRQNPASKEPPESSLAIVSFQMIAGGEPLRGRQFLLLRFNRGAYTQRGRPSGDIRTVLESTDTVSFHEEGPPSPDQGPLRVCLQYAVFPGIPCLSATAFRAAVALSLPLASPVRPYSGACRNGKRANRGSAFLEKRGRQGLLAGKLSRIFLMKRKKGMHPKLGIQHFFARKLFLS